MTLCKCRINLNFNYLKNYNIGNETSGNETPDNKSDGEVAIDLEYSNLTLKNIDEKELQGNEIEEIKSFFAKG